MLFEKILLLYEEVVVVKIMKLIIFVVNGILINVNNLMNGLLFGFILFYGIMDMMIVNVLI